LAQAPRHPQPPRPAARPQPAAMSLIWGTTAAPAAQQQRNCGGLFGAAAPPKAKAPPPKAAGMSLSWRQNTEYRDLPQDTWSMFFLALVRDFWAYQRSKGVYLRGLRLTFALLSLLLTTAMQIAIPYWVSSYVVNPAIHQIQNHYKAFRSAVYDGQGFLEERQWMQFADARAICKYGIMDLRFLGAVLFLWSARMLYEIREIIRFTSHVRQVKNVPATTDEEGMIDVKKINAGEEIHIIRGLPTLVAALVQVFICLPKLLVTLYIGWVGLTWLTATQSFRELLLNALALEFVTNIDELVVLCAFPESTLEYIRSTKLAMPAPAKTEAEQVGQVRSDYHGSLILMLLTGLFVYCYIYYLQQVIPFYEGDLNIQLCSRFYSGSRICGPFQKGCFPYGDQNLAPTTGVMLGS